METMATDPALSQLESVAPVLHKKLLVMQEVVGSEVTASFVLHHLTEPNQVNELLEKLKEGGHTELVDQMQTSEYAYMVY